MTRINSETFAAEIRAAGLASVPYGYTQDEAGEATLTFGPEASEADRAALQAVWDAHDPDAPPPAPVPESISDRQFAYALALMPDQPITLEEAEEWSAIGTLPPALLAALEQIPEGTPRALARGKLRSATEYRRDDELTVALAPLLGKDAAYLDEVWRLGATL